MLLVNFHCPYEVVFSATSISAHEGARQRWQHSIYATRTQQISIRRESRGVEHRPLTQGDQFLIAFDVPKLDRFLTIASSRQSYGRSMIR